MGGDFLKVVITEVAITSEARNLLSSVESKQQIPRRLNSLLKNSA